MKRAEQLFLEWSEHCPPEVPVHEFDILVKHFLAPWLEERQGTSHRYHITHEALTWVSYTSGFCRLTISVSSGRRVKAIWVRKTLKAIRDIYAAEQLPLPGGE